MEVAVKNAFLTILKSGLWNIEVESALFPLTSKQWQQLYDLSIQQTLDGIIMEGILTLPTNLLPPKSLMLQWSVRLDTIERINLRKNQITNDLVSLFSLNGIKVMLLKGQGLAQYYEKPLQRVSGDIDFYFDDLNMFEKANKLIEKAKVKVEKGSLNSTIYVWKGIEVEHHTRMIDVLNPFCQDYLKDIQLKQKNTYLFSDDKEILIPSPQINQIQVNAHILKHFIGFGIGLRQYCDAARLSFCTKDEVIGVELYRNFKKLGILPWMNLTYSFLVNKLGLPIQYLPYEIKKIEDTDWLLDEILTVGNFGFYDQRHSSDKEDINFANRTRKNTLKRVLPHMAKGFRYAPYEVLWYPVMKGFKAVFTKIIR